MRAVSRLMGMAALGLLLAAPVSGQEQPNLVIVLDGSGSMWGQVGGRTKIELARESLSQVLSEATSDMQIGMVAYGHRVRGQCSDIEQLVPIGPANSTVPAILDAARRITPRGMTPLTDAVMDAAQRLRFTEQAATVVLLTDGVETCAGDPCALGRMLEQQGIDFTAHVVGFDMTDAEQRTVSCLAEETGGLFLAANDAEDLARALRQTIIAQTEPEIDPMPTTRQVNIILRDTNDGAPINGRQIDMFVEPLAEDGVVPDGLRVTMDQPVTALGQFHPGTYRAFIRRATSGSDPVSVQLDFVVPEGDGTHVVDLVLAARLRLSGFAHSGLPMPERSASLPFAAYGSSAGRAHFTVHPVIDGAIDTSIDYGGINNLDISVPPGDYFIRGGLSRSFSRERLVRVPAGEITDYAFDFEAARVFVDMRDAQGFPVERLTSYFYDSPNGTDFLNGGGRSAEGLLPFYLPVGTWRVDAGRSGGGAARAQAVFTVSRPGQDITLDLREGDRVDDAGLAALLAEGNRGCLANLGGEYGCLIEAVSPADFLRLDGIDPDSPEGRAALAPRFNGSWQTSSGPIALVQDGRRVWGDVPNGVLLGEVADDGLTLRGAWANGLVELRLSPDGQSLQGRWGRGLDSLLAQSEISGQRISGGNPRLQRATGAASDLPEAMRGAEFEAFMAPARLNASGDLDQMQADAPAPSFGGVWATNHQVLTLHQQGRRVWGERERGTLEGEVSADGRTLRGTWTTGNDWGTLEFVLDRDRRAFSGRWGRGADADLRGGGWDGTRRSYLSPDLQRDTAQAQSRHPSASDAALAAFLTPVQDPDLPVVQPAALTTEIQQGAVVPDGFEPNYRADFKRPDGSLAISFVFGNGQSGGEAGGYTPGLIWLVGGWCGDTDLCPEEFLTTGGPTRSETPNAIDRVLKGGVIPGASSAFGQIAFEVNFSGALDVHVLTAEYDDAIQLGPNRALVSETFGTFQMEDMRPASFDSWPIVELAPVANPDPVQIGAIDVVPVGVFAVFESEPGETALQMFERARIESDLRLDLALQCAQNPNVSYPDGLIAIRYLDSVGAGEGRPPYTTESHEFCDQSGPILTCNNFIGAPGRQNMSIPNGSYTVIHAAGPDGMFAQSTEDEVYVFTPCYGPNGFQSATEIAPDGVPMWQHVVRRDDGGQGIEIRADGTAVPVAIPDAFEAGPVPALPDTAAPAFTPVLRNDFTDFAAMPRISFVFSTPQTGGDLGYFADGFVWLHDNWCGTSDCPQEVLPVGGRFRDDVPNSFARLDSGGLIPALSAELGYLVFEVNADGTFVHQLNQVFTEADGLGANNQNVARTLGFWRRAAAMRADLTGWPALPGAGVIPQSATTEQPSADFSTFVGIWAPADSNDPQDVTCFETPMVGHADGRFEIFRDGLDDAGLPTQARDYLHCTDVNACRMMRNGAVLERMANLRFSLNQLGPDRISLCAAGEGCVDANRCAPIDWTDRERASGLAARWEARVMERN